MQMQPVSTLTSGFKSAFFFLQSSSLTKEKSTVISLHFLCAGPRPLCALFWFVLFCNVESLTGD